MMLPLLNTFIDTVGEFNGLNIHQYRKDLREAHAATAGTSPYSQEWFDQFLGKAKFSVIVIYRGIW